MNKYFYLLAAGLLVLGTSRAQIKKGESWLGGYVSFQKVDNNPVAPNYGTATIAFVSPSFGKAIRDNLLLGVSLTYGTYKTVQPNDSYTYTLKYSNYGVAFFLRRYKDLGRNFSLFLEGDLGGVYIPQKGSFEGSSGLYLDNKSYSINATLSGGIAYRIMHRWQLEAGFQSLAYAGFGHSREDGSVANNRSLNSFNLGTNLNRALNNISIGCRYMLN